MVDGARSDILRRTFVLFSRNSFLFALHKTPPKVRPVAWKMAFKQVDRSQRPELIQQPGTKAIGE